MPAWSRSLLEAPRAEGVSATEAARSRRVRALLLFYLLGTLTILATVFLPRDTSYDEQLILAVSATGLVIVVVILVVGDRLPDALVPLLVAYSTVAITALNVYGSTETSPYAVLYLWVVLYAAAFLPPAHVAVQVALVALGLTVSQAAADESGEATVRWVMLTVSAVVIGIVVTMLKRRIVRLIAQLERAARTDALTGLGNRGSFDEALATEVARARRGDEPLTLVIGDLDAFKALNDGQGHEAGDAALRRVALLLRSRGRRSDLIFRIGGEEFALLLPRTRALGGMILAEQLRSTVDRDEQVPVTISFGVATLPQHAADERGLLRAADAALYAAKDAGRNRTAVAGEDGDVDAQAATLPPTGA